MTKIEQQQKTIADNLTLLSNTKKNIQRAIRRKGVDVGNDEPFSTYPAKIDAIEELGFLTGLGYPAEFITLFKEKIELAFSLEETFDKNYPTSWVSQNSDVWFLPKVDTSGVSSMLSMFYNCHSLISIPCYDTSSVTNMQAMCYGCSALQCLPAIDTSKVTNMQQMFAYCGTLQNGPDLDTKNVSDMYMMYYRCYFLSSVPQYDTANVVNMSMMFYDCMSLITIPPINTSNVENMQAMFSGCSSLKKLPALDTSKVKNFNTFLLYDAAVERIEGLDFSSVQTMVSWMSSNSSRLRYMVIHNLGKSNIATIDLSGASNWGTGSDENRQSLIDSLITYSFDRAAAGLSASVIKLSATTKALLTEEEIAQITDKGFSIA